MSLSFLRHYSLVRHRFSAGNCTAATVVRQMARRRDREFRNFLVANEKKPQFPVEFSRYGRITRADILLKLRNDD
jgi:hypothetical protein